MGRVAGWDKRLNATIQAACGRPFHAREHNCATFARACVEAVTGGDLSGLRWCGSVDATVEQLGLEEVNPTLAQRGDVVIGDAPDPAFGVCVGHRWAAVGKDGLMFLSMSRARRAWRVPCQR